MRNCSVAVRGGSVVRTVAQPAMIKRTRDTTNAMPMKICRTGRENTRSEASRLLTKRRERFSQWKRSDSNREPRDYESPALTVELRFRCFHRILACRIGRTKNRAIAVPGPAIGAVGLGHPEAFHGVV